MTKTVTVEGVLWTRNKQGVWICEDPPGYFIGASQGLRKYLDALYAAQQENAEADKAISQLCDERDWYHDKLDTVEAENARLRDALAKPSTCCSCDEESDHEQ